jgi:hypothetical protein
MDGLATLRIRPIAVDTLRESVVLLSRRCRALRPGYGQVDEVSTNIGYLSAMMTTSTSIDRGDRFPAEVIEHAVWLCFRSTGASRVELPPQ